MISLYCGKENLSALSPEWVGLIGVIAGTILTGLASYFIQRSAHKKASEIEDKRNRVNFLIEHVIKDVCAFIDREIDFLQDLHIQFVLNRPENSEHNHRSHLANIETLIRMLNDEKILSDFNSLLNKKDKMETIIVNKNFGDKFSILKEAMVLASNIKVQLMAKL